MIATNESDEEGWTDTNPADENATVVSTTPDPEPELDKSDFLTLIANALKAGTITPTQAKQMRQEIGIFQGTFTGKKTSAKLRKNKRKAQKRARKVTRNHGFKGQKVNKGNSAARGR